MSTTRESSEGRLLVPALMFIALVVAAVASLGTPLITSVATTFHVSLDNAQWTLTIALLSGALATPILGRLGAGPHRRATILGTLAVVVAGSALTVLPLSFACLLIGRAAQGVGLGLTALMMGVARDHLPEERSASTIAVISVVSIIGVGVGYPLAALLTEIGGVRAAYGLGLLVTAIALLTAWRSLPAAPEGRSPHLDMPGALLLAGGLFLVLFLASETSLWSHHLAVAVVLAIVAVLLLCVWTVYSLRTKTPLVDVRAVRHPAVAGANIAMFVSGIGMYLLLTLITRYAQTPHSAGYGFGLTTFVAGLVLVPFSVLGFVGGKLTPRLRKQIDAPFLLAGSAVVIGGGFVLFASARSNLAELFIAMGLLGLGVGSFSAAMPGVILGVTPKSETSSAMSFNYVVRSVAYSLGSAIGGLVLAAGTGTGRLFPNEGAFTTAALIGIAAMAITTMTSLALARQRAPETEPKPTASSEPSRRGASTGGEHLFGWCGFPWRGAAYPFGEIGGPVAAGAAGPVDGRLDVDAEQARQNRGGQVGCPCGERGVAGLPGLDPVLAEPAGQGRGCDGPCGRPAGEEGTGARVGGSGVEQGADEGGEPGREEDRDSVEAQARVGAVLLDVGGGEPGQARGELAVKQQERSDGPDVDWDARVAQAPAEQLPAAVFGDEPGQLGRGQGRDGDLAGQAAGAGPGEEVPQQVAVTGSAVEPGIDVGLGGGAQGGAAVIEPGQERQGAQDAAAGPPGGGHGEGAAATGAAPGAAQHVPGRVGAYESGVLSGPAREDLAEPGLDPHCDQVHRIIQELGNVTRVKGIREQATRLRCT
jgi:predicted MFS family arabinose efflux permease